MKGGVCITRRRNDVARDVPIKSGKLEFVSRTAQRLNDANSRVAPAISLKEEFVSRTAQRRKDAALRDVPNIK